MQVILLGVSHRTAPVEVRERLDFSSRDLGAAVEALAMRPSATESVVLSTCNRSEIYVVSNDPAQAREEVTAFLSEYHDLPPVRVHAASVLVRQRGCGPAPVQGGRRSRFDRRRRAADPGAGQGRFRGRRGAPSYRSDAEQAVSLVLPGRQARQDAKPDSAKARYRSASPPSRSRERSSVSSPAGGCSSSGRARSAR